MASTTSIPSTTWPNTVCLRSRWNCGACPGGLLGGTRGSSPRGGSSGGAPRRGDARRSGGERARERQGAAEEVAQLLDGVAPARRGRARALVAQLQAREREEARPQLLV